MPNPPSPEELAARARAMGPVAHLRGPLSPETAKLCAEALAGEARQVEQLTVAAFRMQTIDVGPGRRVVTYEIEYQWDEEDR